MKSKPTGPELRPIEPEHDRFAVVENGYVRWSGSEAECLRRLSLLTQGKPAQVSTISARVLYAAVFVLFVANGAWASGPSVLPDKSIGLVASTDTKDVCGKVNGKTYTKRHRSGTVERSLHCPKGWEADHRVPLAAGGADDVRNIWCEPPGTPWGWKVKDWLDTAAWRAVCVNHSATLPEAQGWFMSDDWRVAYCRLRKMKGFRDPACDRDAAID